MSNAYQATIEKQITGTDAQKVAILQALSQADIPAAKLRRWLSDNELLSYDGAGWFGRLEEVTLSAELTMGIRSLKERVLSGDPVRTADPAFAPKVLAIVQGVAAAVPEIAGLVDSFYALDGGRPWKDLTVEQLTADRDAVIAAQAAQTRRDAAWTVLDQFRNQIGTTEQADGIAAMRAMLDGLEAG
jgi:hypothetical protein